MFYKFWRIFFRFLFSIFRCWEVEGLENFPRKGPVIVVANHMSYWDPVLIGCALPRRIYFMAKKELFAYPVFGRALRMLGAFPVDRGQPDRFAIKRAFTILKNGDVLGIFPEGRRNKTGKLLAPSMGAAYIAVRTSAQVCPVALVSKKRILKMNIFRKFCVRIGVPAVFECHEKNELQAVSQQMMEKIQELIDLRPI